MLLEGIFQASPRRSTHQLHDLGKEPRHQLAALTEPLAEEAVCVDLNQLTSCEPASIQQYVDIPLSCNASSTKRSAWGTNEGTPALPGAPLVL